MGEGTERVPNESGVVSGEDAASKAHEPLLVTGKFGRARRPGPYPLWIPTIADCVYAAPGYN